MCITKQTYQAITAIEPGLTASLSYKLSAASGSYPDRTFHDIKASKSVDWRIYWS